MIHFSFELTNAMNDMIALGATDEQINEIFNFKIKKSVPSVLQIDLAYAKKRINKGESQIRLI